MPVKRAKVRGLDAITARVVQQALDSYDFDLLRQYMDDDTIPLDYEGKTESVLTAACSHSNERMVAYLLDR